MDPFIDDGEVQPAEREKKETTYSDFKIFSASSVNNGNGNNGGTGNLLADFYKSL